MKKIKRYCVAIMALLCAVSWNASAITYADTVAVGDTLSYGSILYKVTASNLIANPNFEDSLTSWTSGVGAALLAANFSEIDSAGINNSHYLVGTVNGGSNTAGALRTLFPTTVGNKYFLSYWVKYQNVLRPTSTNNETYLKVSGTNTAGSETLILKAASKVGGGGEWARNDFAFTAQYNYLQVHFRWLNSQFGFDQFSLNQVDSVGLDLSELNAAITAAQADAALEYDGLTDLNAAIDSAETVRDSIKTVSELAPIIAYLQTAVNAYHLTQNASTAKAADVTSLLINPSFELKSTTGWTYTSGAGDVGAKMASNTTYNMIPTDGDYLFNIWASSALSFFVNQQVTKVPNGFYSLSALVASDTLKTITLYANDTELPVASRIKTTGVPAQTPWAQVTDSTLNIGAKSSSWFKADNFKLYFAKSIDYTSSIVNPTIEGTSNSVVPTGWTISKGTGNNYTNTGQHYSGVTTNRYLDSWNGTAGSMIYVATQVVDEIPNGFYKLSAAARTSGTGSYITANDKQTQITNNGSSGGTLGAGWSTISVDSVVVMDSTITIGAKTTTGWTGTWFGADDFTLEFIGNADSATYKPYLDNLLTSAKAFDLATSPNGIDTLLLASIATAEAASDVDAILAAYTTLKANYNLALASVSPYAAFKVMLDTAIYMSDSTSYAGLATFEIAVDVADSIYSAGTTLTTDVETATLTLRQAIKAYLYTQPATKAAPADLTYCLENNSFELGSLTGWTTSTGASDVGAKLNSNSTYTMNPCDGKYVFNIWGGTTLPFFVQQTLTDVPEGFYSLSACVASDAGKTITLYINGKELNVASSATGKSVSVYDTLEYVEIKDGTITIGAKSQTWFKADNFCLSYVPKPLDLTNMIINPTILGTDNSLDPEGWTVDKGLGNTKTTTGQHWSGVTTDRYLDSWNATAGALIYTASQEVESIPNGFYTVTAAARADGTGTYIFASDKQTEIINNGSSGGTLSNGWNYITVDSVVAIGNALTIGAKTTTGWTGTWFSADDFSMAYYGEADSATYKPYLDSLIVKAQAFDLATSPNGVDSLLLAAIVVAQQANSLETILSGYSTLKAAYNAATASVEPLAELKALIVEADTMAAQTAYPGLDAFNVAIDAAEAVAAGAATVTADVEAAITALDAAMLTYQATQNAPADFTFVIVNPSFEEGEGGTLTAGSTSNGNSLLPLGWNVTRDCAWHNSVLITDAPYDGTYGYEMWSGTINKFSIDQTITAPRTGFYTLSAVMRSNHSTSQTGSFNDAHVFANIDGDSLISDYLGNQPGFIPGTGWNTLAAWQKLSVSFKADSGQVINLGGAATCFLQMDDYKLKFMGDNDPSIVDIGYFTKKKTMDATADSVEIDPIYRMLTADTLLKVTMNVLTDVTATSAVDISPYDVIVIQESFGGGDGVLTPAGPLGLAKLTVPTLYNKTYAFKSGRAISDGSAAAGGETAGVCTITVDSANLDNDLFNGLTFVSNQATLLKAGATDLGATSGSKALNYATGVTGVDGTLLAYPTGSTPSISFNDIAAGDSIGDQPIQTRIITFGINFGAMCREHGLNVTNNNYTLWRNAIYILGGLTVPEDGLIIDGINKATSATFDMYPNPTSDCLNIRGLDAQSTIRIFNVTGQQLYVGLAENETTSIDLSSFAKGLYLLQVESNGKSVTSKVVKK